MSRLVRNPESCYASGLPQMEHSNPDSLHLRFDPGTRTRAVFALRMDYVALSESLSVPMSWIRQMIPIRPLYPNSGKSPAARRRKLSQT